MKIQNCVHQPTPDVTYSLLLVKCRLLFYTLEFKISFPSLFKPDISSGPLVMVREL